MANRQIDFHDACPVRKSITEIGLLDGMSPEELYDVCNRTLCGALKNMSLQQADKEDCIQEVWLSILAKGPGVIEAEHLPAWISRVARNKAIDRLRKRSRSRPIESERLETLASRVEPQSDEVAGFSIWRALADLDNVADLRSCLVFCLRCLEGWSFNEIAAVLRMTPSQARLRNHRIKQLARKRIGLYPSFGF